MANFGLHLKSPKTSGSEAHILDTVDNWAAGTLLSLRRATVEQLAVDYQGRFVLGGDVNLYRSSANVLKTDDDLEAAQVRATTSVGAPGLSFQSDPTSGLHWTGSFLSFIVGGNQPVQVTPAGLRPDADGFRNVGFAVARFGNFFGVDADFSDTLDVAGAVTLSGGLSVSGGNVTITAGLGASGGVIINSPTAGTGDPFIRFQDDGTNVGLFYYDTSLSRFRLDDRTQVDGNFGVNGQTPAAPQAYTVSNLTTDRTYDADSTTVAELADVLGTLIADLRTIGLVT